MHIEKIQQNTNPRVPELIMQSLIKAMEDGHIRVGEDLPSERDLAEMLGVGRGSLRECLAILEFLGAIDGRGNRLAAMVYGIGKTVYIVAGTNKICPDFDSALSRARNTAAVQNMQRFDGDQPCHTAGRCLDCRSKSRGCNALLVLWGQMMDMAKVEVVLIDEPLGL